MDFSFTAEQEELAALVREICTDTLTEERMRDIESGDDRFDRDLYGKLAEAGALGIALPTELGGGGYGVIEQCRVLVELGRTVAPVPMLASVVMGAGAIARFGSPEQQRAWVPAAVSGERVLAAAVVEDLNPDPASPVTRATREGDGWTITGAKTPVVAGPYADLFLVPASVEDGVRVFLVEPGDAGVSVHRQEMTNGDADALLELDGVRVTDERVLPGDGAEIVRWITRHATVGLCALQLGVCERAEELTAAYAKERVQFDRPIATFQAVGQRLADGFIDVEGIRLTLWQAAWCLSEGLDCDQEIATAKFWASDAGHRIAHTTVHIHGGVGIDLDHPTHRYFVAAKRIEFALGSATDHLRALGAALAAEPV